MQRIPPGRVASYGEVGRAMTYPASGFMVGRWMAQCPPDVPWWRVVSKSGALPIAKQSPELASDQERRLRAEGVLIEGGLVAKAAFIFGSELADSE